MKGRNGRRPPVGWGVVALFWVLSGGCAGKPGIPRSSDWVTLLPDGEMKRKVIVGCTPCHPIGLPAAMRLTGSDWEETYLKMKKLDDELELRLIPFHPGELSQWLATHAKIPPKGARIRTAKAAYREYPVGPGEGFYHDMVLAHGKAWIADYFGNVLYGVDPGTGATESHPIPVKVPAGKPGGAHAMDTTAEGELWTCFTKAEQVGRFDPVTKEWKLYSGYPPGGNVQYFVLDKDRNIYRDEGGGIWTTHFSLEALCRLDPATGGIRVFKTPPTEGFPENGVHLYAGVADSKGRIWYTETHGNRLGVLDTRTGEAEEFAPFPSWSGPKRLAIDERDRLWIPHLGVGHVTLFDTRQRKVLREIPVPIPGDYIYAIRRNPHTGDLWMTGAGSDALYRLDPRLFKFRIYRLPRAGAYTRTVAFEENGNVWTNYASFPNLHTQSPHGSGVIVRLVPE